MVLSVSLFQGRERHRRSCLCRGLIARPEWIRCSLAEVDYLAYVPYKRLVGLFPCVAVILVMDGIHSVVSNQWTSSPHAVMLVVSVAFKSVGE